MDYDPAEVYEVIAGAPGSFVALRVQPSEGDTISFHDTARVRTIPAARLQLKPLTLASWNRQARARFNPQAPRYADRAALVRALRAATRQAH